MTFAPGKAAPEPVVLHQLVSWSDHPDAAIKGYSGTATYHTQFEVPAALVGPSRRLTLDLGQVEVMASVKLNGKDLGILWKSALLRRCDGLVRPGTNELQIGVVNLWINRQIADEACRKTATATRTVPSRRGPTG